MDYQPIDFLYISPAIAAEIIRRIESARRYHLKESSSKMCLFQNYKIKAKVSAPNPKAALKAELI
jgi:hypothetical protein